MVMRRPSACLAAWFLARQTSTIIIRYFSAASNTWDH
jgi:hypothetical protein